MAPQCDVSKHHQDAARKSVEQMRSRLLIVLCSEHLWKRCCAVNTCANGFCERCTYQRPAGCARADVGVRENLSGQQICSRLLQCPRKKDQEHQHILRQCVLAKRCWQRARLLLMEMKFSCSQINDARLQNAHARAENAGGPELNK